MPVRACQSLVVVVTLVSAPLAGWWPATGTTPLAGGCQDGNSLNLFAGHGTDDAVGDTTVRGTRTQILYRNPDLCGYNDTDGSASVAWSMVQARSKHLPSNPAANMYAQAGYGQFAYGGHAISTFTQYTRACKATATCGTQPKIVTVYHPTNPTNGYVYETFLNSLSGQVVMHAGPGASDTTDFQVLNEWSTNWIGVFSGETLDHGTDIVGTSGAPATFGQIKKLNHNNNWVYVNDFYSKSSNYYRYHATGPSNAPDGGKKFSIYTDPL